MISIRTSDGLQERNEEMKQISKSFRALGTVNSITVCYDEDMEEQILCSVEEIKADVCRLDDLLSVFKESSEISRINASAGHGMVAVSPDTYRLVKKAVEYSEMTGGAFDITSRPLTRLWGIGSQEAYIPEDDEILRIKQLVNYRDILLADSPMSIGLRYAGQAIDLGSIAKGYAVDLAVAVLKDHGVTDAVINFGGSVAVLGEERRIGVQHPLRRTGVAMAALTVKDQAVVTSGNYERYFQKEGKRYHHLLDVKTGRPAEAGISSVTLIGESAAEMDAITTAVFVTGMEAGLPLLKKLHLEAIIVSSEQKVLLTGGLRDRFELIDEKETD